MSEFGHIATRSENAIIDAWSVGPYLLTVGAKTFRFDDSERFGPLFIKKNGAPLKNQGISARSPFWDAHSDWITQGRKTEEDGVTCIYKLIPKKPMKVRCVGGRHFKVIENGDGDPDHVEFVK